LYFYKDLFASLCFITFGAALAFNHPYLFFAALMFGALSRTAARKQWDDPPWAARFLSWRRKRKKAAPDEE